MHVLFVEPSFPRYQRQFARALHSVGARVTGIGESAVEALDTELKSWLHRYEHVTSVTSEDALYDAVRRVQDREWVDRLEATVEAHVLPTARVRAACMIPGTSERTAFLCRDKPAMKEVLRQAGIPCAQSTGARSAEEVRSFVASVGFPVILKPSDAAGAAGTHKVENQDELERAIRSTRVDRGTHVAVEEFIEGHEGFYDTITIEGTVVHEFISHYYPNVLEAMRARWISPEILVTNRTNAPGYDELKQLGQRVIRALGIGTSATHMEWFYGPKGLKFSEIGCRPPGVSVWDLYGAGNDIDVYAEWARAIVHGRPDGSCSRRFATGMIALRPERDGRISGYEGRDLIERKYRDNIIDSFFPPPGSTTQPVEAGYMANAWMRLRHPDYDALRGILDEIGRTVRVLTR